MHDPPPAISFQKKTFSFYSKRVNMFIAISESVAKRTLLLGCKPERICIVHNGVRIPESISERNDLFCKMAGWRADVFIIGITGQMTATKGSMDLIHAFKNVLDKNPLARLVIGGKKLEPLYTELNKEIISLKLEEFVFFPGWMENISDFFSSINVFVLASRHEEGYGLVVAEAMATSLPVVITASGGAVEIVEEGISGFIVSRNNISEMSSRLIRLADDPHLCNSIGRAGRKRIEEYFDIRKQSEILFNCLSGVKEK
jgi:glycosyltransferase involved in cell wall biosynthesis